MICSRSASISQGQAAFGMTSAPAFPPPPPGFSRMPPCPRRPSCSLGLAEHSCQIAWLPKERPKWDMGPPKNRGVSLLFPLKRSGTWFVRCATGLASSCAAHPATVDSQRCLQMSMDAGNNLKSCSWTVGRPSHFGERMRGGREPDTYTQMQI